VTNHARHGHHRDRTAPSQRHGSGPQTRAVRFRPPCQQQVRDGQETESMVLEDPNAGVLNCRLVTRHPSSKVLCSDGLPACCMLRTKADPKPDSSPVTISATSRWPPLPPPDEPEQTTPAKRGPKAPARRNAGLVPRRVPWPAPGRACPAEARRLLPAVTLGAGGAPRGELCP
jgi:hypothetical protein